MCGRIRTEGLNRTIGFIAVLAVAISLTLAGTAAATPLDYTFSGSNQGWLQAQDPASGPFVSAGFQPSGGNPGGRLSAKDSGAETGCPDANPCQLLTFYSPFVPTLGANYGGTASFDLRSSVPPEFAAELLLLPPPPEYLDGKIPENVGLGYQHLSIQMTEGGNWAVCPYAGGACHAPGQAEFMALIGSSDGVAVMADVGPNRTGEAYDLDNVVLTDGAPPPAPPAPPPPRPHKKPKKCKKKHTKKHKKRGGSTKKKKCKKKKKKKKKKPRAAAAALRG